MNMPFLYQLIGFLVFWGLLLVFAVFIICLIYDRMIDVTAKNWFHYYIQRTVIPTDILRHNYRIYHKYRVHGYWILKYRLRNIRRA